MYIIYIYIYIYKYLNTTYNIMLKTNESKCASKYKYRN